MMRPIRCIACGSMLVEEDLKAIPLEDEEGLCLACVRLYAPNSGAEVYDDSEEDSSRGNF